MLEYKTTKIIKAPFIMDIFLLDVMSEMLSNPLYFFSYINKRTQYFKTIRAHNELVILGYHLKANLFLDSQMDLVYMADDISSDLDAAFYVRRKGFVGVDTPDGILTHFKNTFFDQFVNSISSTNHKNILELGLLLLSFSEDTISGLNDSINKLINMNQFDNSPHSITLGFDNVLSLGLLFHTDHREYEIGKTFFRKSYENMKSKYKYKYNYGIFIDAKTSNIVHVYIN